MRGSTLVATQKKSPVEGLIGLSSCTSKNELLHLNNRGDFQPYY